MVFAWPDGVTLVIDCMKDAVPLHMKWSDRCQVVFDGWQSYSWRWTGHWRVRYERLSEPENSVQPTHELL